jgi:hypothetical protein
VSKIPVEDPIEVRWQARERNINASHLENVNILTGESCSKCALFPSRNHKGRLDAVLITVCVKHRLWGLSKLLRGVGVSCVDNVVTNLTA